MVPRPKDAHGPRRGLSAHFDPEKALPEKVECEASKTHYLVKIDIGALDRLEAYRDATGHVSFRPPTQEELDAWIESHGKQKLHTLTQEIRDAVVGNQRIER